MFHPPDASEIQWGHDGPNGQFHLHRWHLCHASNVLSYHFLVIRLVPELLSGSWISEFVV